MLSAAHPHPEIPKVALPPRAFDRERTKIVMPPTLRRCEKEFPLGSTL